MAGIMFDLVRKYMDLAQTSVQTSFLMIPTLQLDQNASTYISYVYTDYKCDSGLRSICPRMDIQEEENSTNGVLSG